MKNLALPEGFLFAGHVSGLRSEPNRRDLAAIVSTRPAMAAGVFTQNRVCAAPVTISRERIGRLVRGIVVCSGNANACTGDQGLADAKRMAELLATNIDSKPEEVLVASTGVIGRLLPMAILEAGIPQTAKKLAPGEEAFSDAAHAIITTDTVIKTASKTLPSGQIVAGFAKGAAMIGPNMATMLGFLFTDASVASADLQRILTTATDQSFNCISVEGHMSTNDTVFLLANGTGPTLTGAALAGFAQAVTEVAADLAMQIAKDAEGANHLVTLHVEGARTDAEARQIAKTIAESPLVKTAIFGADPNWGRVVSAAGYSGVPFEEREMSLTMGDMPLYLAGQPLPFDAKVASAYLKDNRDVTFTLTLTHGTGRCTFYTCDLTYKYVELNADYTT
ncbi:MAG: bifunctional glutamate N-acetyltransferase/amino-acid acetyltransferase ArgJ [Fimbriiglobus sp.]